MKPEEICKIVCIEPEELPCKHITICNIYTATQILANHYETVIIPARIAEAKKDLIALLDEAHDLLDAHNSLYATDQEYCSYCHAKAYNSTQGIIHYDNCIIKRIRQQLKKDMGV